MLSVLLTTWLLLQLPVALTLGRWIACPQKWAAKRTGSQTIAPRAHPA